MVFIPILEEEKPLRHGTQAEIIKLYIHDELFAYGLLGNYDGRRLVFK